MLRRSNICITKYDYERLIDLLKKHRNGKAADSKTAKKLRGELKKARKVDSKRIPPDYVTMNSVFELKDIGKPGKRKFRLVFPNEADLENGNISVLAPAGTAVLGYREGDIIKWDIPSGVKYFQINKIIYQPEATGDYHL
jgi:regulator of nucleoside diphosphate kinase